MRVQHRYNVGGLAGAYAGHRDTLICFGRPGASKPLNPMCAFANGGKNNGAKEGLSIRSYTTTSWPHVEKSMRLGKKTGCVKCMIDTNKYTRKEKFKLPREVRHYAWITS